jgi:hypothetical protein
VTGSRHHEGRHAWWLKLRLVESMPLGESGSPTTSHCLTPYRRHRLLYRVLLLKMVLVLLEEELHFLLKERCLQEADRRLEVLRGNERRCRPGAPRCLRRRRLEAGERRQNLRDGTGVRRRAGRLLRRVRGGKERVEGRDSAVVEAKQMMRRGLLLARGRDRAEGSRERVLERRDAP